MAAASSLAVAIDLDDVPLSPEAAAFGTDRPARLAAATAGDDYELLFAAPEAATGAILALERALKLRLTPVGRFDEGSGLSLSDAAGTVPLPARLGYEHGCPIESSSP
jgi:thiamine-monophosphate kinase